MCVREENDMKPRLVGLVLKMVPTQQHCDLQQLVATVWLGCFVLQRDSRTKVSALKGLKWSGLKLPNQLSRQE